MNPNHYLAVAPLLLAQSPLVAEHAASRQDAGKHRPEFHNFVNMLLPIPASADCGMLRHKAMRDKYRMATAR